MDYLGVPKVTTWITLMGRRVSVRERCDSGKWLALKMEERAMNQRIHSSRSWESQVKIFPHISKGNAAMLTPFQPSEVISDL